MALLSDCHRRIEMFLGSLERLAKIIDQPLSSEARKALDSALRYFRESAPKHTADEEESLFPRLREQNHSAAQDALTSLGLLEHEHVRSNQLHSVVDTLGKLCLEQGHLSISETRSFRNAVSELALLYKEHIRIEDNLVFPAADEVLSPGEKEGMAREMAARRGLGVA